MPLQFREAPPGIEIWTGRQNTRVAAWVDQSGIDVKRNLLLEVAFVASKDVIFALFEKARLVSFPSPGVRLAA